MRTTRRADERDILVGARGGKRDWNDEVRRGMCEGVAGSLGDGKDARTSYMMIE